MCNASNAYIATLNKDTLPVEFKVLQYSPREWKPTDTIVIGNLLQTSAADLRQVLQVNVEGTFLAAKAVVSAMTVHGRDRIINIGSDTVWMGTPGFAHYVADRLTSNAPVNLIGGTFAYRGAPVFEGQKNAIVRQNNQPDRNTHCTCPNNVYNGQPCNVILPPQDAGNDVKDTGTPDANDGGDGGDGG